MSTPTPAASTIDLIRQAKKDLHHILKEAFQLTTLYFIFQGIMLSAVYKAPDRLKCRYHWLPFTMSFLAGILHICALVRISYQYKKATDRIEEIRNTNAPSDPFFGRGRQAAGFIFLLVMFLGFFAVVLVMSWQHTCTHSEPPK